MPRMSKIRLILQVLIYREDRWWIAHCLDLDLVAEGNTPREAIGNLLSLTDLQVKTAMEEGDLQSIFRPAPPEMFAEFAKAPDMEIRRRQPKIIERFEVRELQPA